MACSQDIRLRVDGKFFVQGGQRVLIEMVTYGPFPDPEPDHASELRAVAAAGFNAIRVYEPPSPALLCAALEANLMVFAGMSWEWYRVFLGGDEQRLFSEALVKTRLELAKWGNHPALAGFFVANEIPPDVARWCGPVQTREALEALIDAAHAEVPELMVGYANYPSSEYLEPQNADFTGFNIYLESSEALRSYLPRLHHLAGDRPVMISEFGIDTQSLGEEKQAEAVTWFRALTSVAGLAGRCYFGWSDRWRVGAHEVSDWSFGLVDRQGRAKPALECFSTPVVNELPQVRISVIVCVYNGEDRIGRAVASLEALDYPDYEVIVVDDGSSDRTLEVLARFSSIRLVRAPHAGLSVARNLGAAAATGSILAYTDDDCEADPQWLTWLARAYAEQGWDACGGPNIPPPAHDVDEAVVASSPGAPSHVMLSDQEAEHIPGCNLSVRKDVFDAIGGFRAAYRVAGDDVDFCWRLREAGYRIGFHGAAFVWHRRRTTLVRYLRQQWGYGKAEARLMFDHSEKFSPAAGARWEGCVYTGGAMSAQPASVIYHGPAGMAGYQQLRWQMMPSRPLKPPFDGAACRLKRALMGWLQPQVRHWARCWFAGKWRFARSLMTKGRNHQTAGETDSGAWVELFLPVALAPYRQSLLKHLLKRGWQSEGDYASWDLQRDACRLLSVDEMVGQDAWRVRVRIDCPWQQRNSIDEELREVHKGLREDL